MWIFDEGGVNGQRYREEILPYINEIRLDYIIKNEGEEPILVQDGASSHKAYATIDLIQSMGLMIIDWPANSPDLNPIENVWSILKRRIEQHRPRTREEVKAAVQIEWNRLTREDVKKCVQSMPERCRAVIDAEGGHTRW